MVLNALDLAAKESWLYVKFLNDDNASLLGAYTNRDSDTLFESVDYDSIPEMEIELPENNGLLNESPCNVILPVTDGFLTEVAGGEPHPPIRMEVVEFTRGEGAPSVTSRLFNGLVVSSKRNAAGRKGFVAMSGLPVKARLANVSLGEPCNHQCINRLGDARCGVALNAPPNRFTVTISSIDNTKVTVTTAIDTGLDDRFYQRGYMFKDGLRIGIQIWRNESNGNRQEFFMYRRPPASWLSSSVTLFAGCDKTIETCRRRWNKESQFNGRGFTMPAYNPVLENGGQRQ